MALVIFSHPRKGFRASKKMKAPKYPDNEQAWLLEAKRVIPNIPWPYPETTLRNRDIPHYQGWEISEEGITKDKISWSFFHPELLEHCYVTIDRTVPFIGSA